MYIRKYYALLVLGFMLTHCGIYSFTGAATGARNIEVATFYNNTDLAPANIGQTFTNKIKDYYQRNSTLRIADQNGDLYLEGAIVQYNIAPVAPQASQDSPNVAALSRLTIEVVANYKDGLNPENNFEKKSFSFFTDFTEDENFIDVQEDLENEIFDRILLDIFNSTVGNW